MPRDSAAEGAEVVARLSGMSKSFAGVAALTEVALTFNAGEVHAILGENGAGKSTLMNIICGELRPDAGMIEIGGQSSGHLTPSLALAAGVAISYQHPAILDGLSVIENLKVALPPSLIAATGLCPVAQEILRLVVGRTQESTFPPKATSAAEPILSVRGLQGRGFREVSFDAGRGEIIGIAGVAGNGQTHLVRALAGLQSFEGDVRIGNESLGQNRWLDQTAFMPFDRHGEGLAADLTIRENAANAALDRFASFGIVNRGREVAAVGKTFASLAVKAPLIEAAVSSLSGGLRDFGSFRLFREPDLSVALEHVEHSLVGNGAGLCRRGADGGAEAGGVRPGWCSTRAPAIVSSKVRG